MGTAWFAEPQGQCEHSQDSSTNSNTVLTQWIPQLCYFCAFESPVRVYYSEHDQTDLNSSCLTAPFFCLFSCFSLRPCSFYSSFTFFLFDFLRSGPGILFLAGVLKIFTVNKSFRAAVKFPVFCPTCYGTCRTEREAS